MSVRNLQCIVLADGLTVSDLIRALRDSGVSISNTPDPCVFRAERKRETLPPNVVRFARPIQTLEPKEIA